MQENEGTFLLMPVRASSYHHHMMSISRLYHFLFYLNLREKSVFVQIAIFYVKLFRVVRNFLYATSCSLQLTKATASRRASC